MTTNSYELKKYQIKWKWITRLVAICFLGVIGIIILCSLLWLVASVKSPPPDMEDLKFLFPYIIPFYSIWASGIMIGLTWFANKKHLDNVIKPIKNHKK